MVSLNSFRSWLDNHHYSSSTVRNYLADIGKYLQFLDKTNDFEVTLPDQQVPIVFSINNLNSYIAQLSTNTNSQRYLASLNVFCQFAVDQNLITSNPIAKIRKQAKKLSAPNSIDLLRHYRSEFALSLAKHQHSPITIKNYINDIDQYINWLETNPLGTQ
jgi:site-specific recombinase XerD